MEISIIIPCLNEEKTIGECVKKAKAGIEISQYEGEVLVADNGSTDSSKEIAQSLGASVDDVQNKGYGNALRGGLAKATGTYVIMGDADGSYDFSIVPQLIEKLKSEDYDLVIGDRFGGKIMPGAMPFLNKFLGNPALSTVGKILYGNVCNDFLCGLRAAKTSSLSKLNLSCTGMEFAAEMIIKSATHNFKIGQIPITLYRDGRGRLPHLRRWRDGFRLLFFMIRYKITKET